ncbi:MAG: hypothetical protein LBK27_06275 [Treponema sp.]|jgi:hypothetical protein|nr:hypothetical protein [Treponema sp.]
MKYASVFLRAGIALFSGPVLTAALFAESASPGQEDAGETVRGPRFDWSLLWTGSWEEGETLTSRGDLRLIFPGQSLSLRAEAIDRRPLDFGSSPALKDFGQGLTNYGAALYHRPTGSRLLYGILDEWGLPARLRNPWIRGLPFAENHRPSAADLKTAFSSTGEPATYLYLGSPPLNFSPRAPGGGIVLRSFATAQMDAAFQPGFGGGLEGRFGEKTEVRLEGFYTAKTLAPRKSSTWFSEKPPLPEREFRLSGLGLLLDTPALTFSSDWAYSETFAWGRDIYGNLGLRLVRPLPAGWGRWALSLAADGAGSRYTGRDGSSPGAGFRSGGKLEWYGKRSSLLRLSASFRAPALWEPFNRSATSLSWRFPAPGKNSGGPFRLTRISLGADRNAADPEKILDNISLGLGFTVNPLFGSGAPSASAGNRGFFNSPVSLSLSGSLKLLDTAANGAVSPFPLTQFPCGFESAGAGGEIYWAPGIFQFRTKLAYEQKKAKEGVWEASASAAVRFRPGRFSVKLSSADFPGNWDCTVSWRLEKKEPLSGR